MANRTKYTVSQKTKLDAAWAAGLRKTGQEFTARIELLAADTGLRVPQVKVFTRPRPKAGGRVLKCSSFVCLFSVDFRSYSC